jgi:hypothetical protein
MPEFPCDNVDAAVAHYRDVLGFTANHAQHDIGVMDRDQVRLFERYERLFNQALNGEIDLHEVASLYASEFIAATPAGVMTGKNDDQLRQVMAQGYARYRQMGTKEMRIRGIRISSIDEHHCLAHVAWTGRLSASAAHTWALA